MASSCHDLVHALDEILREVGISVEDLNNRCSDVALTKITRIGYDWEVIATELGLSEAQINDIKEENTRAEMRKIRAFTKWKGSTRNPATYKTLVSAFLARERLQNAREICEIVRSSDQDSMVHVLQSANVPEVSTRQSASSMSPSISIGDIRRRLERKFAGVQRGLMNTNGVTVKDLTQYVDLATLPSFQSEAPILLKATSMEEFFHELKNYCTTLNPDILEDLVEELGDEETRGRFSDFTREYENFEQMKLKDLIGNFEDFACTPPGYKELELKLGDNWREKTLADLKRLKKHMSDMQWFLKFITGGSITVTYLVPNSETLHSLQNLEEFCQSQDVLKISMEGKLLYEVDPAQRRIRESGNKTISKAEQKQCIQLGSADLQSSRKSISRSVDLITWNINKGNYKGAEHPTLRDKLLHIVKKSISEDGIYFLQEITNHRKTGECFEHIKYLTDVESRSTLDTGISSPPWHRNLEAITKDCELIESDVTDTFIRRLLAIDVTFRCKRGEEYYSSHMILMSYHASKCKETTAKKISRMMQFFDKMCDLADKKKRTIIIGGYFNLSVLHWKPRVEEKYPGRVSIALYPTTPRRSDVLKFVDTFAIVQPINKECQTECHFRDTVAIYPFPVVDTSEKESVLQSYPPTGTQTWFKYIRFNKEDVKAIKEIIEKKRTTDAENREEAKKDEEIDAGKQGEEVEDVTNEVVEILDPDVWLTEYYSDPKLNFPAVIPLWPCSPLNSVFDHDPIFTKLYITLTSDSKQDEHKLLDTKFEKLSI